MFNVVEHLPNKLVPVITCSIKTNKHCVMKEMFPHQPPFDFSLTFKCN